MKLGAYTAVLHDRPLADALKVLGDLGLTGAEINSGGFLPPVHIPMDDLLTSAAARDDYLGRFRDAGITLTGLNCNGNPLNPLPDIGPAHAADLHRSIEVAGLLGVDRVVTMSGVPGSDPGAAYPSWVVNTWDSQYTDVQDYQWELAVPFWRDVDARARDAGVKVCIEMHPHNVVFNPPTLRRLVERTSATNVGAEMDPSHLFWQGIDPTEAVTSLGSLVYNAAAKDTRINPLSRVNGNLDDAFRRVPAGEPGHLSLGGPHTLSGWPEQPSWDFVAVGRGHDVDWWAGFLAALAAIDPDMPVNIEHEDQELDQLGGLRSAADTLIDAASRI
jgi:sugar phosphate isomerase/epimerase